MPASAPLRALACLVIGVAACGPSPSAMYADDELPQEAPLAPFSPETRTTALEPDWQDAGYTYFADPDVTEDVGLTGDGGFDLEAVREGCLVLVDTSRVEIARAIEVARSLRAFDRVACLDREAQVLPTLESVIAYGRVSDDAPESGTSFVVVSACRAARESRHRAERCAARVR